MLFKRRPKLPPKTSSIGYFTDEKLVFNAFPKALLEDIKDLLANSPTLKVWNVPYATIMINEDSLKLPLRVYVEPFAYEHLSKVQQLLYHCLLSRSSNGYVRESSLKLLLEAKVTDWVTPYIFIALGDYVVEVADMSEKLSPELQNSMQKLLCDNPELYRYVHDQVISYWNEYYRARWMKYRHYPPCKLLTDIYANKSQKLQ